MPYKSYIGFTWGSMNMHDVDMLVVQASPKGRVRVRDMDGVGHRKPKKDKI